MRGALLVFTAVALSGAVFAQTTSPTRSVAQGRTGLCGSIVIGAPGEEAVLDTVEERMSPVPHCFIHGRLDTDRYFRIQLPNNWNQKFVLALEGGFGGDEFGTANGVFGSNYILAEGYAVAESNQGHIGPVFN